MTTKIISRTGPALAAIRASQKISWRQLIQGLVTYGFITPEEGIAAATVGAMPAGIVAVIQGLPADQQAFARITWGASTEAIRTDPLVEMIRVSRGMSHAEIDAFFAAAAQL